MLSAQGGVEIEAVAERPRRHRQDLDRPGRRACPKRQARTWVEAAKLNPAATDGAVDILLKLYRAYVDGDADLAEINPLILTPTGEVHALDAKVTLDDNAVFRHPTTSSTTPPRCATSASRPPTRRACSTSASTATSASSPTAPGLAMSTLDVVNQVGGQPANFLDIGGGANADVMAGALEVINNDPNVRSIFINIFGGITKGEEVANGIVEALGRVDIASPIVIRLDGTNADEGRAILQPHLSDRLQMQPTMLDAARTAVELAGATK